ncbi:MAG: membrane protein insertase YidC [Calditrichaeota bacterium]|nr:membrane protein insertase YidC [Calditrichota bacterium]
MFDRNTLLALVLVGLILLGLPYYQKLISPPQPATPPVETVIETAPTKADATPQESPKQEPEILASDSSLILHPLSFDSSSSRPYNPELVEIETPLFKMTLGSDGRPTSYILEHYNLKSGPPVDLHAMATPKDSAIGSWDLDLGPRNATSLAGLHFDPSRSRLFIPSGQDSVELNYDSPDGKRLTLYYIVDAEKYGFDLAIKTNGFQQTDTREYKLTWQGGVPSTEPDPKSDHEFGGAYAQVGEELENTKLGTNPKAEFTATGRTPFVAVRSKYFIAAVVPQSPAAGADVAASNRAPQDASSPHHYDTSLRLAWESPQIEQRLSVYWGPIKKENLEVYGVGLENTMNWGWAIVKPFSLTVLWLLKFFGRFISNYGLVIIIFSVIVKVVLWPLTRKSQVAMKKMASLKPELEALKERHAKNPQALNKAMMDLYKERGVNPAAGCIPLLIQMPILYGLFIVFRSTIEFRQAPFFGWINDLSQPDYMFHLGFSLPLYGSGVGLLPIVMGISQFFMSKATLTDPNQKAMLYIMPVMMFVLFNNFPSGLTLYYTLFNFWAIIEQRLIKIPQAFPEAVVVEDKPKKGKK